MKHMTVTPTPDWRPPPDDPLRGSVMIHDPVDDVDVGHLYAEVACGGDPNVSVRVPFHEEWLDDRDGSLWLHLPADVAATVGQLLTRMGGAAAAYLHAEREFNPGS